MSIDKDLDESIGLLEQELAETKKRLAETEGVLAMTKTAIPTILTSVEKEDQETGSKEYLEEVWRFLCVRIHLEQNPTKLRQIMALVEGIGDSPEMSQLHQFGLEREALVKRNSDEHELIRKEFEKHKRLTEIKLQVAAVLISGLYAWTGLSRLFSDPNIQNLPRTLLGG